MMSSRAALLAAALLASPSFAVAAEDLTPDRFTSPDGKTSVRIAHEALPSADPDWDFFTIEVSRGEKVILRAPTFGYLLDASWSPCGQFLAVNNRRANCGDYLWVFDLRKAAILKRPDDKIGEAWADRGERRIVSEQHLSPEAMPYKIWLLAKGWDENGNLRILLHTAYGDKAPQTRYDAAMVARWDGSGWKTRQPRTSRSE